MRDISKSFFFLGIAILFFTVSCRIPYEEIEAQIAKSERLSRLNSVCASLPVLPGNVLLYKRISGNSDRSLLIFYYSKKISFDEAARAYADWLNQNGWEKNLGLSSSHYGYYKKGDVEVIISSKDADSLEIGCTAPH